MATKAVVRVHPVRSGKVSETFHIEYKPYKTGDRAKMAVAAVKKWAAWKHGGANVEVEVGTLIEKGDEGSGRISLNGVTIAQFSATDEIPAPVPAASLFGGGR